MDLATQRTEEAEVLCSIYGGDPNFQVVDSSTYQYCVEPDQNPNHPKRFMLQIIWPESYPESTPTINLDIFYNNHLPNAVKQEIIREILEEATVWQGSAATYTLFEFAKENVDSLISDTDIAQQPATNEIVKKDETENQRSGHRTNEHLNSDGKPRPRGWNWMDIVKHLSQTGSAEA